MDEISMKGDDDGDDDGEDAQHAGSMAAAMALDERPLALAAMDPGKRSNRRCSVCPSMRCDSFNVDALISTTVTVLRLVGALALRWASKDALSAGGRPDSCWAFCTASSMTAGLITRSSGGGA
ncbi:hypothetical protein ACN9MB_10160 [Dyella kyungheensis]|uniref:hypothetical protein n=1 Tax=Dyella kyungheensis TaxID=1242174 RepID=UPI003CE787AD